MRDFVDDLCENIGSKQVTKTDKDKGAFVLNAAQRDVLAAAGYLPGDGGGNAILLTLDVPNDPDGLRLEVSYYNSVREGAGRTPEARMGRDIVHWMEIGETLHLANVGKAVFVWKDSDSRTSINEIAGSVAAEIDRASLLEKARKAKGKPPRQKKVITDFRRNLAIVAGAISRANGSCEMPNCMRDTFTRKDGSVFLEVHHIIPLAEGGDDTMLNAAALCPTCHREIHYGTRRLELRKALRESVKAKEEA